MKRTYYVVILTVWLLGLMLSGCAKLSIHVEILDSAYWISPQHVDSVTLAQIVSTEQAILGGRYALDREKLAESVKQILIEKNRETPLNPKNPKAIEDNQLVKIVAYSRVTIDNTYNKASDNFQAAFDMVSASGQATRQAKTLYIEGATQLKLLGRRLSMDLGKDLPLLADSSVLQKIQQIADSSAAGLIGSSGILNDPRAASVVYAPTEYWTGNFNKTLCTGAFGNTDCAVKMEGLGDFTLKGVRLDATKITQATFSAAGQAIQIIAAVYGVPIQKSQPDQTSSGGQAENQASVEISSPVKRQRDAETAIAQLRLARIAMLEAIVAQRQAIEGNDDTKRKAAIKTIKSIFDANSKLLDPGPTQ
jgi:hypothetical protein